MAIPVAHADSEREKRKALKSTGFSFFYLKDRSNKQPGSRTAGVAHTPDAALTNDTDLAQALGLQQFPGLMVNQASVE